MTYDLFNQLLYIRSTHNNEADFLNELKNMTQEDVSRYYKNSQNCTADKALNLSEKIY